MSVGYFRDRGDIQQDSAAAGAEAPDYSGAAFLSSVPCQVEHVSGNESLRGRQLEAHVQYSVKMHWTTGVKPTMRWSITAGIWSGRILNIETVEPVLENGRAVFLRCLCSEVPA